MCISFRDKCDSFIVVDSIISMLDRSDDIETWDSYFFERWTLLELDELDAVIAWVLWLIELEDSSFSSSELTRAFDTLGLLRDLILLQ